MTHDNPDLGALVERIQTLASCAAQNRQIEQRSLTEALAEVRSQVTALSKKADSDGPRASPSIDALTAEVREAMGGLRTDVAALRASLFELGEHVATIEQRLATLQVDVTAIGSGLFKGKEEADARIREIVSAAQAGTEQRVAAHISELLLAVAEALIRPRDDAQNTELDRHIDLDGHQAPSERA